MFGSKLFVLIKIDNIFRQMNVKSILKETGEEDPSRVYKLELSNRNIKEIPTLKQLEKLRCLVLSYNLIERIENLQVLADLRELHLQNNGISKIEGLQSNKVLQVLNLSNNLIEKIQNIGHLIRLQTLDVDSNRISKISGLQYLKQLKHISAKRNMIASVQNLPAFSKLVSLNFSHNKISNISANLFASSKNLSFLNLSHNKIQNTSFLQALASLQNLNLNHNRIKELQVNPMPNLQSLNVSNNQLEKIPLIALNFPELMSLDISYNMICSEHDILIALGEVQYLTELDFRHNPMHTETFENALQKIHNFDFLNGKVMTKAGAKYYQQVNKIKENLDQNSFIYGEDDQKDREIKMSGFYDDELQFKMSGMKVNRPQTPPKKKKNLEKATFYDDIDRVYHQFVNGDLRIKVIRQQYLKICGDYNIASQHILTQIPVQSVETIHRTHSMQEKSRKQLESQMSQQYINSQAEIRKQNQKNLNKWKELKQRQKSFNIRDVIKKSRGRDNSINKVATATSSWATNGFKSEKLKNELLRTQALPRKNEQLFKTIIRPSSMRKKQ